MYRRLQAGEFGNTIPRWFDADTWEAGTTPAARANTLWGVQHRTVPGFPGTRLNVPGSLVRDTIREGDFGADYVISIMVGSSGAITQWEGDVWRGEDGLYCSGHFSPDPGSWRRHMLIPYLWSGTRARMLLELVLNANSLDDLRVLLDTYPGHVIELSALDRTLGTVPGRNAVVWECRRY